MLSSSPSSRRGAAHSRVPGKRPLLGVTQTRTQVILNQPRSMRATSYLSLSWNPSSESPVPWEESENGVSPPGASKHPGASHVTACREIEASESPAERKPRDGVRKGAPPYPL